MNISKHIAAVAAKSENNHNNELLQFIWNNRNTRNLFDVNIVSVAKSGMSRKMAISLIYKGRLIDVTEMVADVTGNSSRNGLLMVRGCGMNMVFDVLYRFYRTIASAQLKEGACRLKAVNSYIMR